MLFKYLHSGMRWGSGRPSWGGVALHLDHDCLGISHAATGKRMRRKTVLMMQPRAVALDVRSQRFNSARFHVFLHLNDLRKKLHIG